MIDKFATSSRSTAASAKDAMVLAEDADLYQAGMTSHASVNVMLALEGEFDVEFPTTCSSAACSRASRRSAPRSRSSRGRRSRARRDEPPRTGPESRGPSCRFRRRERRARRSSSCCSTASGCGQPILLPSPTRSDCRRGFCFPRARRTQHRWARLVVHRRTASASKRSRRGHAISPCSVRPICPLRRSASPPSSTRSSTRRRERRSSSVVSRRADVPR